MVANSSPGVDRIGSTYPGRRRWWWPKPRCNCRRSVGTQVPLGGPHLGPWAGPGPKIQMCIFNYDNYIEKKWVYTYTWNSHIVIKVFTLKEWWLFFAFLRDCDIIFQLCFVHCSLHCLCNNIVYIYKCVCACVCVCLMVRFSLHWKYIWVCLIVAASAAQAWTVRECTSIFRTAETCIYTSLDYTNISAGSSCRIQYSQQHNNFQNHIL